MKLFPGANFQRALFVVSATGLAVGAALVAGVSMDASVRLSAVVVALGLIAGGTAWSSWRVVSVGVLALYVYVALTGSARNVGVAGALTFLSGECAFLSLGAAGGGRSVAAMIRHGALAATVASVGATAGSVFALVAR